MKGISIATPRAAGSAVANPQTLLAGALTRLLLRVSGARRIALALGASALLAIAAGTALAAAASAAAFGSPSSTKIVDNSTLNPPAPDYYTCYADGANTICRGITPESGSFANEDSGLDCGGQPIYSTGVALREATRYYDQNGDLVWRRVHASVTATWSLSPTGAPPTVSEVGHWGWTVHYSVPGDVDSGFLASHGTDELIRSPDGGVIVHEAGTSYAVGADFIDTGVYHGPHLWTTDPDALAKVCAALGA